MPTHKKRFLDKLRNAYNSVVYPYTAVLKLVKTIPRDEKSTRQGYCITEYPVLNMCVCIVFSMTKLRLAALERLKKPSRDQYQ